MTAVPGIRLGRGCFRSVVQTQAETPGVAYGFGGYAVASGGYAVASQVRGIGTARGVRGPCTIVVKARRGFGLVFSPV